MTGFESYWKRLEFKNAELTNPENGMRLTVFSFRKLLQLAWNAALADEKDTRELADKFNLNKKPSSGSVEDMLKGMGDLFSK